MGRDRLRRGYSLEVIFEEESDFCSQLDSLDAVPFGYSTTADTNNNQTQKDFSVIELLGSGRKSHGGISIDSWDYAEDSIDASLLNQQFNSKTNTTGLLQCCGEERRNLETNGMDSCFESHHIDWDVPSTFHHDCHASHKKVFRDVRELSPSSESQNSSSGRCSRVSRRQIVEANWLAMDEEDQDSDTGQEQILDVDIKVTERDLPPCIPFPIQFYSTDPPMVIIDASPDKTRTGNDPKKPTQRSSELDFKVDPHENVFPLARSEDADMNGSSESRSTSASSSSTDVKRVREMFETGRGTLGMGSSSDDDENSNRVRLPQRFNKRNNPISSANPKSKLEKKISAASGGSDNSIRTPLRSAYSQLSLNQMERYDYVDLLVNDNIIIEDSPDIFQTLRNERNRSESSNDYWGLARSNFMFKVDASDSSSTKSTLRRSKSVGTGIHNVDALETSDSRKSDESLDKSRPSIIAEELPARNTVRNVRSVFEQILQKNGHPKLTTTRSVDLRSPLGNSNGQQAGAIDGNVSPTKKALLSIKSNPTSKIFRTESLRNETGQYGTSVALKCNPVQGSNKAMDSRCGKSPRQDPNLRFEGGELQERRPEEDSSSTGTNDLADENDEPKLISPDVLHRIRSLGTTTTYYGGEILSKTVKNQKCPVGPRRNQTPDSGDEVDFGHFPPSASSPQSHLPLCTEDFLLISKSVSRNPDRRPYDLHLTSLYEDQRGRHPADSLPRIISVLPKSPSNSPTKSNSPVRSFLEGRNSPEGCESNTDHQANSERWINTVDESQSQFHDFLHGENESGGKGTLLSSSKSSSNRGKAESKKFSDAAEGVWF